MNTRSAIIPAPIILILMLTGCSSMSQQECQSADWHTIGYEDGSRGLVADTIGNHRRDCAEYGVTPDLDEYMRGRELGLEQYCNDSRGFLEGRGGGNYWGVCPEESEGDYLAGYSVGRQVHEMESRLNTLKSEYNDTKRKLSKNESDSAAMEQQVVSDEATKEERIAALEQLKQLSHDEEHLREQLALLDEAMHRLQEDISAYLYETGYQ